MEVVRKPLFKRIWKRPVYLTMTPMTHLAEKTIVLGITGSIAAVRTIELAHELIRRGATVQAVMTKGAERIIHPDAIESATGSPALTGWTGRV